ncbi:MAG: hypothetical protein J6K17_04430 [Oscillospiraceae bacterium]|nr:hypothetical protein [Oscillospiraceae bacterium]
MKKILAAIAACAVATSMLAMTAFAAATEGNEEVLEEEVTEEVVEEEVTEEEVEVEEPAEEPAEEVEVENPTTGNSAVALAVIPVALAAAAVVAKKAK